jgi:hypothetical protein
VKAAKVYTCRSAELPAGGVGVVRLPVGGVLCLSDRSSVDFSAAGSLGRLSSSISAPAPPNRVIAEVLSPCVVTITVMSVG